MLAVCALALAWPADAADLLTDRAERILASGRVLDAWSELATGLESWIARGDFGDDLARADAEIAAIQLADLTERLENWSEAAEVLGDVGGLDGAPPPVGFRLQRLLALALVRTGRPEPAREILTGLGYTDEFLFIGPFDNERGSGFDVAYPPERAFDRTAEVPGKERPVSWRRLPAKSPLYRVPVGALVRPNEQAACYLATAVESSRARTVVLRIGSSCAIKVFHDGVERLSRKVKRPHEADQDLVVLALEPGWNQLLIKLANEDQDASFECRFTELDGRPAEDLRVDTEHVATPPSGVSREPVAAAWRAEARSILEARDDPDSLRLLALYHLLVHPDDVADRSARAAAERLVELDPEDPNAWYLLARAEQIQGESTIEKGVNRWLHALKRTVAGDPSHVPALLDLADFYLGENPQPDRVDALTRAALEAAPSCERALSTRARHLRERRRTFEAEELEREAEQSPDGKYRGPTLARIARRMIEKGDAASADRLVEQAFLAHTNGGPIFDLWIDRIADKGDVERAAAAVRTLLAAKPYAVDAFLRAAHRLEYAGGESATIELLGHVAAVCPEDTRPLISLARIDLRAGRVEEAKRRLQEVVRLDPGNDKVRRHLALLESERQDDFHLPYRWDAADLIAMPEQDHGGEEMLEVLRRTKVYKVNPDGTEHTYEHIAFRPLRLGGVKQLDTYLIRYAEDASIQILNARVIHRDGTSSRAPLSRAMPRGISYFDLPPMSAGDVVDVEYRVDEREPDVFGKYFGVRHQFYPDTVDSLAPTWESELVIVAPADVPLYVAERNAEGLERSITTDASGSTVRRWVARGLKRPVMQTMMPDPIEFLPVVDVTTFESWDAFSRWYWSFIEKEFVTTPEMKAKVRELTEGLETEDEKVAAINRFVAQEIRYNSWPFGTHGYEPFSAATIFERRFGDCKDKSILLRQLLAEIGVEAVPVLIMARYRQPDDPLAVATVSSFNHCIAYLPPTPERDGYYLDATASHNPVWYLRADDQGARVLHVWPDRGEIHLIPYAPPEKNSLNRRYVIALEADGSGEVVFRDDSTGQYAVMLRYRYAGQQGDLQKVLAEELNDEFGAIQVESIDSSDLEDITVPSYLEARFRTEGLWTAEGERRTLRTRFDDLGIDGVAVEVPEERKHPVVLDRPYGQETVVLWKLPDGVRVGAIPPPIRVEAKGLLEYSQEVEVKEGAVEVRRRFRLDERRIGLDRYAELRDALKLIRQAEERTIDIKPAGVGAEG